MPTVKLALGALLVAAVSLGCAGNNAGDVPPGWNDGPGTRAWNNDRVKCNTDSDCNSGEQCTDHVCQMRVCTEPSYTSHAPLGQLRYFTQNREIAALSDDHYIDTYEPQDGSYSFSFDFTTDIDQIGDVAGGNFFGSRPQHVAYSHKATDDVVMFDDGTFIHVGIWPIAIAAGDVDADGTDELVALSQDGNVAVCNIAAQSCNVKQFTVGTPLDIAVGDVDGDGFAEPVVLFKSGDKRILAIWNVDKDQTAQAEEVDWTIPTVSPSSSFGCIAMPADYDGRIAAGDLDGDGTDEIVVLQDSGGESCSGGEFSPPTLIYDNDVLQVFGGKDGKLIGTGSADPQSVDVSIGDTNNDGNADVVTVASQSHLAEIFSGTKLGKAGTQTLDKGSSITRVVTFDADGDSPAAKLQNGPVLVSGDTVPVAVMVFPPYYASWSQGRNSSVGIGSSDHMSTSVSETVALHMGTTITAGGNIGPFSASASHYITHDTSSTYTYGKSMSVGKNWNIDADPSIGRDYAGIVLASGCFHGYTYLSDDPANLMGGSGQQIAILVPVGGDMQIWSTRRYNAMAAALGTMPPVTMPYTIGDVSTYPTAPVTLDGNPVDPTDMLFTTPPQLQVSDVGTIGFSLNEGDSDTNSTASTVAIGTNGTFGVGGQVIPGVLGLNGSITEDVNTSWSEGYSLTVGQDTSFWGNVPPLPDNRDTPEDEFAQHRYSFSPFVYRQHYTNATGNDSAYYVVTYTVGQ